VAELLELSAGRNAKLAGPAVEALRAKAAVRNIRELEILGATQ